MTSILTNCLRKAHNLHFVSLVKLLAVLLLRKVILIMLILVLLTLRFLTSGLFIVKVRGKSGLVKCAVRNARSKLPVMLMLLIVVVD